jgi:hypothetical protein
MLKAIYKFLLVTLLSGSLLMLDFGVKGAQLQLGFNHSYAVTDTSNIPPNCIESSGAIVNSEQCSQYKNDGQTNTPTNTNNEPNKKVKLDAASDNDLMSTLTMTSIGLLAQRLYKCKLTSDMMAAAAGGAAYIAGEIMATFKLKSVMKELEKEIKKTGTVTEANNQIEDFKKLKKSYEDAKGTANTKKMLQMAAAAAFAVAGVLAYTLYSADQTVLATCNSALKASNGACMGMFSASCASGGACYAPYQIGGNGALAQVGPMSAKAIWDLAPEGASAIKAATSKTQEAALEAVNSANASACSGATIGATACKAIAVTNLTTKGYCPAPLVVNEEQVQKTLYANNLYCPIQKEVRAKNFGEKFIDQYIFSNANADLFSPLGIISSAAISFALATSATLGTQIDMFLFSPMNRAIIWGVLAGLTYMASTATDNQIKKIEENIQKIQAIIDELEALRKGNTTASALAVNTGGTSPKATAVKSPEFNLGNGNYQDVDMSKEGVKFPCINGEYTNHCDNFSNLMNEKTQNLKDLPPDLKSQISTLSSFADGINGTGTLSTGTMANAASLAAQANALRSNLNSKQQKIQDMLNRNKNNKINLAARSNAIKNDLLNTVGKELEKRGSTPAKMLASFGGSGSLASKYAATSSYGDGSGNGVGAGGAGAGANGANGSETLDPSKIKNTAASIDIGQGSSELSEAAKAGSNETNGIDPLAGQSAAGANGKNADGTKTATMDDYDLKNDINLNKDVDIFKVITNRYQKSAYPRLFKRVK